MRKGIVGLSSIALVAAALAGPSLVRADGLPIPRVNAKPGGVATRDGRVHYVTGSSGGRTVVARVNWATGETTAWNRLPGRFSIPAVAVDGSPGGLSANGRVLALIKPRRTFPQSSTQLVVLDARRLEVRRRIHLQGDFSFDAISPDGNRIYLIQYLSRRDPTRYAVRAYNVRAAKLVAKPIIDPTEPDEQMRGYPLTRVASPDGRWQYTLYSGGDRPFVHALDTRRATARCIDLPHTIGNVYRDELRIDGDGTILSITNRNRGKLATVNASTFKVSTPAPDRRAPASGSSGAGTSTLPWVLIALGVGLVVAVASLWGVPRLHRRRLAREG
jgi:hypothetical protein